MTKSMLAKIRVSTSTVIDMIGFSDLILTQNQTQEAEWVEWVRAPVLISQMEAFMGRTSKQCDGSKKHMEL